MTRTERLLGKARGRCRAVIHGDLVWAVATAQGRGATVAEQTRATLAVLEQNLSDAGSGKDRILEAVIYLADMETKAEMDEVWCAWIPEGAWPCRACVGAPLAPGDRVALWAKVPGAVSGCYVNGEVVLIAPGGLPARVEEDQLSKAILADLKLGGEDCE